MDGGHPLPKHTLPPHGSPASPQIRVRHLGPVVESDAEGSASLVRGAVIVLPSAGKTDQLSYGR